VSIVRSCPFIPGEELLDTHWSLDGPQACLYAAEKIIYFASLLLIWFINR
jgi:hypothetical protein